MISPLTHSFPVCNVRCNCAFAALPVYTICESCLPTKLKYIHEFLKNLNWMFPVMVFCTSRSAYVCYQKLHDYIVRQGQKCSFLGLWKLFHAQCCHTSSKLSISALVQFYRLVYNYLFCWFSRISMKCMHMMNSDTVSIEKSCIYTVKYLLSAHGRVT